MSALVATPTPLEFMPAFASSPASTTVTYRGPASCSASSTTSVSAQCGSQSQFCARMVWPESVTAGSAAIAVHSPGAREPALSRASRALADSMISVRTLSARIASNSCPEPSARPRISSR